MRALLKTVVAAIGLDPAQLFEDVAAASLKAAIREQGLEDLVDRLRQAVPDLSDQYTRAFADADLSRYREIKARGVHAFQIRCTLDALDAIGGDGRVIVDIGDSSGNHGRYIHATARPGQVSRIVSVNLDPVAVDKVRAKGGEAILSRAEELDLDAVRPDLFVAFQTLEHFTDPLRFLHALATKGSADHLLFTVPWRRRSRFGGWHMRQPEAAMPAAMTAEEVHIWELCPADWQLMARFAGYRTVFSRIYRQYPRRSRWRVAQPLWQAYDFEGFLGLLLRRDPSLANRYTGW